MNGQKNECTIEWMKKEWMHKWLNGQMNEEKGNKWTNKLMEKRLNG